ncbi:MAG: leucine-rich repeat protein, partial [Oscillospiraceae bacterium]|nr:leucine-rich repeat protein [Oscillospiraceae bacterium]
NGVTSVGDYAFADCTSITDVSLPDTVRTIGKYAFNNCRKLEDIDLPDSVTVIDDFAFENCAGLVNAQIPDAVTRIGKSAFENDSSLVSVTLPKNLLTVDERAFYNCSGLTGIDIPEGTTTIGAYAFYDCSAMTYANIPDTVQTIGVHAFDGCSSLTQINIPGGISVLPEGVFAHCSAVEALTVPANISKIDKEAFADCSRLKYLDISSGVTDIGDRAFYGDPLTHIHIPNGTLASDYTGVGDLPTNEKYYYPLNRSGYCYDITCPLGMAARTDATVDYDLTKTDTGTSAVLTSEHPDVRIYYTLENRSTLTTDDPSVANGGTVDFGYYYGSVYLRAYDDGAWGPVTRIIIDKPYVAKPVYSATHVFGGRLVTFNCPDPSVEIYYEIGTSATTLKSKHVKPGTTVYIDDPGKYALYCRSYKNGAWSDGVSKYGFNNIKIVTPRVVKSGTDKYRIFCTDKDSFIIYTTDGTTPVIKHGIDNKLRVVNGKIALGTDNKWSNDCVVSVGSGKEIRAIAVRSGLVDSDVVLYTT